MPHLVKVDHFESRVLVLFTSLYRLSALQHYFSAAILVFDKFLFLRSNGCRWKEESKTENVV